MTQTKPPGRFQRQTGAFWCVLPNEKVFLKPCAIMIMGLPALDLRSGSSPSSRGGLFNWVVKVPFVLFCTMNLLGCCRSYLHWCLAPIICCPQLAVAQLGVICKPYVSRWMWEKNHPSLNLLWRMPLFHHSKKHILLHAPSSLPPLGLLGVFLWPSQSWPRSERSFLRVALREPWYTILVGPNGLGS
jgi:hypothetical protein